jgi:hypothetical protein
MNAALLLNADVEPSNAFSLKRRRPRGGRVRLVATVPNPGRLVATDVSSPQALPAAAALGLVKRKVFTASAAGKVRLNLRLTRRGRSLLRRLGTLRLRIKVVYTPTFGKPATRRKRARLSR